MQPMNNLSQQLPLAIKLRNEATFKNYYPGNNITLIKALQQLLSDRDKDNGERFIYLWGARAVGRSHLLQACCHEFGRCHYPLIYLPLRTGNFTPAILQGMEEVPLVCIDDIDCVLGELKWEEALLHFYNRARDRRVKLIITGNTTPLQLPCVLADLKSRLSWGLVFHVYALSDEQKLSVLQMHARQRGMCLSSVVAQFLLRHYPRDMAELCKILDTLDHASLTAKKRLTVPFVKRVLGGQVLNR